MGYKRKVLHFTFEDTPGLEVWARSLSVRKSLEVTRKFADLGEADIQSMTEEQAADLFAPFVSRVVSWTLEDEDEDGNAVPVPVTIDAFLDWDMDEAYKIFLAWMQRATNIAVPTEPSGPATPAADPLEAAAGLMSQPSTDSISGTS